MSPVIYLSPIFFAVSLTAFIYILIFRKGKDEGILDDLRLYYLIGTGGVAVMSAIFFIQEVVSV